jgi:hypothetical protein
MSAGRGGSAVAGTPRPKTDDPKLWASFWNQYLQEWRKAPEVDEDRKQVLRDHLARAIPDQGLHPFAGVRLARGDVEWLTENLLGDAAFFDPQDRESYKPSLRALDLQGAVLWGARLQEAWLPGAQFQGADLSGAHLQEAWLLGAQFQGADLAGAYLQGAGLLRARLQGADLMGAQLQGARIQGCFFDAATDLSATLGNGSDRFAYVADVHWGDANLAIIPWRNLQMTGEEWLLRRPVNPDRDRSHFDAATRASRQLATVLRSQGLNEEADRFAYRAHVIKTWALAETLLNRAVLYRVWIQLLPLLVNRRLSLRAATMLRLLRFNRRAHRFTVRARALKARRVAIERSNDPVSPKDWLRMLISCFGRSLLSGVSGYGYRPARALFSYAVVIAVFWLLYLTVGQQPGDQLSPLGAFVLSVSSFHGRGFFPGLNTQRAAVALADPRIAIAAIEAAFGLFVEVTLIATFTQRFFAR